MHVRLPMLRKCARDNPAQMASSQQARVLNGKEISAGIRDTIKQRIAKLREIHAGFFPRLAIVQVGDREDSNVYIRMKIKAGIEIGVDVQNIKLPRDTTQQQLTSIIKSLNGDTSIHGIILQLPLDCTNPINADYCTNQIAPCKDVDGLTNENAGKLSNGDLTCLLPCTPAGCLKLIQHTGIDLTSKRAVVIGRSKIVVCVVLCNVM